MKTIIVAGGKAPSKKLLTKEITQNSYIIAADSGADCLYRYKITPHYLIGDLDSISNEALKFLTNKKVPIEIYPRKKNLTDAELALEKAVKLKAKEIVFLGSLGGNRVDHLLGALNLLNSCLNLNIKSSLKDEHQVVTLIKKSTTICGKPDSIFSIQAYGGPAKGLTITGGKYHLKNHTLDVGDNITLSNEFCTEKVNINLKSGKLLVILINQPDDF